MFKKNLKKDSYSFNIKDLVDKSHYIQSFCVNEKEIYSATLFKWCHHLPLKDKNGSILEPNNWDLTTKESRKICFYWRELDQYAGTISSDIVIDDKLPLLKQVLPPWIVFPLFPKDEIYWNQGKGEFYFKAYQKFLNPFLKKS